jgi:3-oxoacyl-[acyl-carrier protein] reductase
MDSKVAVVTGAAREWGLGRQIALALARKGVDIAIADLRDDWGSAGAAAIAHETGRRAIYVKTDITRAADVNAMVNTVIKDLGRIDILVNDAAIVFLEPVSELTESSLDRMMNINFKGTALCCQAVLRQMKQQGGGRIVNVASEAALAPLENLALYSASKAAVVMFGKVMALEAARHNIIVTTVAPGPMLTAMGQERGPADHDFEALSRLGLPFGRPLYPQEVAEVIAFAATNPSHALTGQTIHANGGRFIF